MMLPFVSLESTMYRDGRRCFILGSTGAHVVSARGEQVELCRGARTDQTRSKTWATLKSL
jgi:hypothetical protein